MTRRNPFGYPPDGKTGQTEVRVTECAPRCIEGNKLGDNESD
jgi:hypothetical protein